MVKLIYQKLKHLFGFHKYYRIKKLSDHSHLLGCKLCPKLFAINTNVKVILDWDLELKDMYVRMGAIKEEEF